MKISKAVFICVCLAGLTQLVWSQNRSSEAFQDKGIPGYLNPRTRTFTTQAQDSGVKQEATAGFTGTPIFFREQANITITNYDQPTSGVTICRAQISSISDANIGFSDSQSVTASLSGNTWTCDVPVLSLWTLQTPTTDSLSLCVSIEIVQLYTLGSFTTAESARESSQPCLTLPMPANAQTVVTNFTFQL